MTDLRNPPQNGPREPEPLAGSQNLSNPAILAQERSPVKAIRQHCLGCVGEDDGRSVLVRACPGEFRYQGACPLWPWRMGMRPSTAVARNLLPTGTYGRSATRAIRLCCLQCCAGSSVEVARCVATSCKLHPFRFGKRPATVARRQAEKEAAR